MAFNKQGNIVGLGHIQFDILLNLKEFDATKYNIDFFKLNTLENCKELLVKESSIVKYLQLITSNNLLNMLLFMNMTSEDKHNISIISTGMIRIPESNKFFEPIICNLVAKNEINIIKSEITNINAQINFIIQNIDGELREFEIAGIRSNNENINENKTNDIQEIKELENEDDYSPAQTRGNGKNKYSYSHNSKFNNTKSDFVYDQDSKYNSSKLNKSQRSSKNTKKNLQNKLNSQSYIFSKVQFDFQDVNYFFIDINDFLFNEYYSILIELPNFLKALTDYFPYIKIVINFPNGVVISTSNGELIGKVLSFSSIIIFDKNDIIIQNEKQMNYANNNNFVLNKTIEINTLKDIWSYKERGIKVGIFIEDMKRFSYLEQEIENNHTLMGNSFIINPDHSYSGSGGKGNSSSNGSSNGHGNTNQSSLYNSQKAEQERLLTEELTNKYYSLLKFAFLGAYFSKLFSFNIHETSFDAAMLFYIKFIDLLKNGFGIPLERNYFIANKLKFNLKSGKFKSDKLHLSKLHRRNRSDVKEEQKIKKKEVNFKLDCVNIQSSKLRSYNPLLDKDLLSFFEHTPANSFLKRLKVIDSGLVIKDINNQSLVKKMPIESEDVLLKYFQEEELKLYPKERDMKDIDMNDLPFINNNSNIKSPNITNTNISFSNTNTNDNISKLQTNKKFHNNSKISSNNNSYNNDINLFLSQVYTMNSTYKIVTQKMPKINIATSWWNKHHTSIKKSPYLDNSSVDLGKNVKSISNQSYNKFLEEFENHIKSNEKIIDITVNSKK